MKKITFVLMLALLVALPQVTEAKEERDLFDGEIGTKMEVAKDQSNDKEAQINTYLEGKVSLNTLTENTDISLDFELLKSKKGSNDFGDAEYDLTALMRHQKESDLIKGIYSGITGKYEAEKTAKLDNVNTLTVAPFLKYEEYFSKRLKGGMDFKYKFEKKDSEDFVELIHFRPYMKFEDNLTSNLTFVLESDLELEKEKDEEDYAQELNVHPYLQNKTQVRTNLFLVSEIGIDYYQYDNTDEGFIETSLKLNYEF